MIDKITLDMVLPDVFVGENISDSHVWNCQCEFSRGEYYLVEAKSGAGKSSMCSFIYGLRRDYQGVISFDGKNIRELSIADWCAVRRSEIAYLPQEMRIFPELTALENVMIKNRLTDFISEGEIISMFDRLGIRHRMDKPAGKLSVGEQQRVAIIRAMCQPASFFILDEPVSHLDAANNRIVSEMVLDAARKQGAAIISTSVGNPLLLDTQTVNINL